MSQFSKNSQLGGSTGSSGIGSNNNQLSSNTDFTSTGMTSAEGSRQQGDLGGALGGGGETQPQQQQHNKWKTGSSISSGGGGSGSDETTGWDTMGGGSSGFGGTQQ
jgi:hypothetical protein